MKRYELESDYSYIFMKRYELESDYSYSFMKRYELESDYSYNFWFWSRIRKDRVINREVEKITK
jgi:hypothetical protein